MITLTIDLSARLRPARALLAFGFRWPRSCAFGLQGNVRSTYVGEKVALEELRSVTSVALTVAARN